MFQHPKEGSRANVPAEMLMKTCHFSLWMDPEFSRTAQFLKNLAQSKSTLAVLSIVSSVVPFSPSKDAGISQSLSPKAPLLPAHLWSPPTVTQLQPPDTALLTTSASSWLARPTERGYTTRLLYGSSLGTLVKFKSPKSFRWHPETNEEQQNELLVPFQLLLTWATSHYWRQSCDRSSSFCQGTIPTVL